MQCWSDKFVLKNEAGPEAQLQIDKSDAGVTGKVDAQNLNGGGVAQNVGRILPLFFSKKGGSILDRFEAVCASRKSKTPKLAWWWSRSKCPANTPWGRSILDRFEEICRILELEG